MGKRSFVARRGADIVFWLSVAALCGVVSYSLGCAGGSSPASSVALQAASEGIVAYEQARISGADPEAALRSAGNAAIAEAIASGSGLVDADYRPFVEATLRVLAAEMERAKVSGPQYPSSASVAEALQHAIKQAEVKH